MGLKRVLIISPYFAPSNAADMQRIRMSLPYFKEFGWDATVITVDERFSEMVQDTFFLQSLPADVKITKINAFNKNITTKLGFGSLGFRSMWHYRKKVNEILSGQKFDLIYFSTTQFPVCVLGAYWKKHFGIPYVIDMQDPWYSVHYSQKAKSERPPKYRIVYGIHKILEKQAMEQVDGLVSVSDSYIGDLRSRYKRLECVPASLITFPAFGRDLDIAIANEKQFGLLLDDNFTNIVYVGRGGTDMHKAITPVFEALKKGLDQYPQVFSKLKLWFIGTSYAPASQAVKTIMPLAKIHGVENSVIELPGRIGYYHTLSTLLKADALFIPGADDPKYSASKIYPYLLTEKPLLAIFNEESNAISILKSAATEAVVLTFNEEKFKAAPQLYDLLHDWANGKFKPVRLSADFEHYSAKQLTGKQTELFNRAVTFYAAKN